MNRFEIKFDISGYNLFEIVNLYNLKEIYSKRLIHSIYFDTYNYDYFVNSEEGQTPRKKIRLRSYNNLQDYSLEFKYTNAYHRKKIVLKNFKYSQLELIKILKEYNINELIYPKIGVTYLRYYFLSSLGRITVDQNIYFQQVNNSLQLSNRLIRDRKIILELKIEGKEREKFDKNEIARYFKFKEIRNSKYCNGVNSFINLY